jgi:hypothetical protein
MQRGVSRATSQAADVVGESIPHVFFVERHALFQQGGAVFILKRGAAMVFLLPLNVLVDPRKVPFANREHAIAYLPREGR